MFAGNQECTWLRDLAASVLTLLMVATSGILARESRDKRSAFTVAVPTHDVPKSFRATRLSTFVHTRYVYSRSRNQRASSQERNGRRRERERARALSLPVSIALFTSLSLALSHSLVRSFSRHLGPFLARLAAHHQEAARNASMRDFTRMQYTQIKSLSCAELGRTLQRNVSYELYVAPAARRTNIFGYPTCNGVPHGG